MNSAPDEQNFREVVRGERSAALVNTIRSVQSRVTSSLAAALMIALGFAALAWYYAGALARPAHGRAQAQSTAAKGAQAEMPLPPLGEITPPTRVPGGPPVEQLPPTTIASHDVPLAEAPASSNMSAASAPPVPADSERLNQPSVKSAAELARERRLAGGVFARVSSPMNEQGAATAATMSGAYTDSSAAPAIATPASGSAEGTLQALLRPMPAAA
ncbi:MAG: hypothetical protein JO299_14975, partial [Gammaproteobacteria bacterium]|nr:hypothetical protein [Gammaproteobacteria bacterium]